MAFRILPEASCRSRTLACRQVARRLTVLKELPIFPEERMQGARSMPWLQLKACVTSIRIAFHLFPGLSYSATND